MRFSKNKVIFNKRDLWNLDQTLYKVICAALEQFKKLDKHSVPPHLYIKDGMLLTEAHSTDSEHCDKEWDILLDKMIFAFTEHPQYHEIDTRVFHYNSLTEPDKFTEEELQPIKDEFYGDVYCIHQKPNPQYTEKEYLEYLKNQDAYHQDLGQRIREGRKLFIEYFDHLWD